HHREFTTRPAVGHAALPVTTTPGGMEGVDKFPGGEPLHGSMKSIVAARAVTLLPRSRTNTWRSGGHGDIPWEKAAPRLHEFQSRQAGDHPLPATTNPSRHEGRRKFPRKGVSPWLHEFNCEPPIAPPWPHEFIREGAAGRRPGRS